jgi:hypothetical protein
MKVAICLASLSFATVALGAIEPPTTLGGARLGSLTVTSGALVEPKSVDLRGVWNDTKVSCLANRMLRVHAAVDYIPARGLPRRRVRNGVFKSPNCAEGGPNVGFTLTARQLGFACPNGTWKPARYNFLTQTTELERGLKATASMNWLKPGKRC